MQLLQTHIILYVANQSKSRDFYNSLFGMNPVLDVEGMTEFELAPNLKLGLMPELGIAKILKEKTIHPSKATGIPRCELYLLLEDASPLLHRANILALQISDFQERDWGHKVAYFADLDGHVLAIGEVLK